MFEYLGNTFSAQKDLFSFLKHNKELILMSKKSAIKYADGISLQAVEFNCNATSKALNYDELKDLSKFNAKLIINTTNIRDSHKDVHFRGIWNKSLNENQSFYLLQEHQMAFDKVISENVKAYAGDYTWMQLGQKYQGVTQALIFDAEIDKERNTYMAEQYAKGYVKNHSVGMRYVKIALAMNSDSKHDKEEREIWDKYINDVVNRDEFMEEGYFFAVTEAKIIEGSAVLKGSNHVTPTLSLSKNEPLNNTHQHNEPSKDTQKHQFLSKLIKNQ